MINTVSTTHPDYTTVRISEWAMLRACMAGQAQVKSLGQTYLPMPNGFTAFDDGGTEAYDAYKTRAEVPDWLATTVGALTGIAHSKEIEVELPPALSYMWENADGKGMPLEAFHRRITRNILAYGRYGVLTDAPEGGGLPYMVGYAAEAIRNWEHGSFYVLDETYNKRLGYGWQRTSRYRVLELDESGLLKSEIHESGADSEIRLLGEYQPSALGGMRLDFIPFAVANSRDVLPNLEPPPLIGVGNAMVSFYRLSADYRHQLYMSGQETLVAINGPAPTAVGAGVVHTMIGGDTTPDLKYVSPTCAGIDAHKEAMAAQRQAAIQAGARMLETAETGGSQESGHARSLRFASETANLLSVVQTSCALLERALRNAARMQGLDPSEVIVPAPVELLDATMTASEAQALTAVWQQGGISYETYYQNLKRGGIASSERTADEEIRAIDNERGQDAGLAGVVLTVGDANTERT